MYFTMLRYTYLYVLDGKNINIEIDEYLITNQIITYMKTRVIITMLALIGIFQFAGAQTIRDNSNVTIGKIERDGTVRNAGNIKIGSISSSGEIRNTGNILIGKIDSNGKVWNKNNSQLGSIDSDGTVKNASNIKIGKVESNGSVKNASNITIGKAENVSTKHAALFFFFGFFK